MRDNVWTLQSAARHNSMFHAPRLMGSNGVRPLHCSPCLQAGRVWLHCLEITRLSKAGTCPPWKGMSRRQIVLHIETALDQGPPAQLLMLYPAGSTTARQQNPHPPPNQGFCSLQPPLKP